MPVDLDALKALYATMLDQIQHAKWTAANRAACKIADDIPSLIAELRELRELREANRWRPIAEAPPPHRVELWWPYWTNHVVTGFIRHDGLWVSDCQISDDNGLPGPTHWRPLSDPPESA